MRPEVQRSRWEHLKLSENSNQAQEKKGVKQTQGDSGEGSEARAVMSEK